MLFVWSQAAPVQADTLPLPFREWTASRAGRFTIEGSVLKASGNSALAYAKPVLIDFELRLEFRPMTEDAEGAILLRGAFSMTGKTYTGYRLLLSDRRDGLAVALKGVSKSVRHAEPAVRTHVRQKDRLEWRTLVVRCYDDRVTAAVDGEIVASITGQEPLAGVVGIESRKGAFEYRDVRVELLSYAPTMPFEPYRADAEGVTLPKPVREVRPRYTARALAAKVQGTVWVEAIVLPDGRIGATTITRRAHPDLDAEAVAAARRWRFQPGRHNGTAVPVVVTIELTFTVK